jgi:hypothetical protein
MCLIQIKDFKYHVQVNLMCLEYQIVIFCNFLVLKCKEYINLKCLLKTFNCNVFDHSTIN